MNKNEFELQESNPAYGGFGAVEVSADRAALSRKADLSRVQNPLFKYRIIDYWCHIVEAAR